MVASLPVTEPKRSSCQIGAMWAFDDVILPIGLCDLSAFSLLLTPDLPSSLYKRFFIHSLKDSLFFSPLNFILFYSFVFFEMISLCSLEWWFE